MKKISIAMLDELTKDYEKLSEIEMKGVIGGGGQYTYNQMIDMMNHGTWQGGEVEYLGYVGTGGTSTGSLGVPGTSLTISHYSSCTAWKESASSWGNMSTMDRISFCFPFILTTDDVSYGSYAAFMLNQQEAKKIINELYSSIVQSGYKGPVDVATKTDSAGQTIMTLYNANTKAKLGSCVIPR